jgi:hypothetical protein
MIKAMLTAIGNAPVRAAIQGWYDFDFFVPSPGHREIPALYRRQAFETSLYHSGFGFCVNDFQ